MTDKPAIPEPEKQQQQADGDLAPMQSGSPTDTASRGTDDPVWSSGDDHSTDGLVRWLLNQYDRHHEIEDKLVASMLSRFGLALAAIRIGTAPRVTGSGRYMSVQAINIIADTALFPRATDASGGHDSKTAQKPNPPPAVAAPNAERMREALAELTREQIEEWRYELVCGYTSETIIDAYGQERADRYRAELDALCDMALRALKDEPAGWVLCPKEPTTDMLDAGGQTMFVDVKRKDYRDIVRRGWKAMIAAVD